MSRDCDQEMCPMWDGEGCPCDLFDLDRDNLPTDGIFTVQWSGGPVEPEGKRRFVTDWEALSDD